MDVPIIYLNILRPFLIYFPIYCVIIGNHTQKAFELLISSSNYQRSFAEENHSVDLSEKLFDF